MFSQYDQRQQAQSAPGWFLTHSALGGHGGKAHWCLLELPGIPFHYHESSCEGAGTHAMWGLHGVYGWRHGWMEGGIDGGMDGWREGGMDGGMDGGMEGRRDGWRDGWMDGGMDGWTLTPSQAATLPPSNKCNNLLYLLKYAKYSYRVNELTTLSFSFKIMN